MMRITLGVFCVATCMAYATTANTQEQDTSPQGTEENEDDTSLTDLEAELAAELAGIEEERNATSSSSTIVGSASSRGLSNVFNPAISANGLVLAGWSGREEGEHADEEHSEHEHAEHLETGLHLQEVELLLSAIVDPFFRADLTLAAHSDEIGFEEAYLSTLEIPRMTLRVGRIFANLGRHNGLHTHAFPFLTVPLPHRELLGSEGLGDIGISADVLLPLPFFTEINLQVFDGDWAIFEGSTHAEPAADGDSDESAADARNPEDFAYVGHLKTMFDFGDSTTIEIGGSYIGGRNGFDAWTHVVGADLTLKWRPVDAERYRSFDWTTEYLWVDRQQADQAQVGGAYSSLRYHFAQQWWAQARGAVLGIPTDNDDLVYRAETLFAFIPSEFSAIRLQYAYETAEEEHEDPAHEIFVQAIFSIGSHPSHAY